MGGKWAFYSGLGRVQRWIQWGKGCIGYGWERNADGVMV